MRHLLDKVTLRYGFQLVIQLALLLCIGWVIHRVAQNVQANLQTRGVRFGFDFLNDVSGFGIIFHLIPYSSASHYWQVFWVGVLNTLLVAGIGIIGATLTGFIVGIASTSQEKTIAGLAKSFVEIIRNIPLLLQLFFWYFVVLRSAPFPHESIAFGDAIFITNRGLYLPKPISTLISNIAFLSLIFCWVLTILVTQYQKIRHKYTFYWLSIVSIALLILAFTNITWEKPSLGRFNFEGGINLIPEFLALVFALSIYTAAYIAEIVRMGIQSVPKGQSEAARSLGFTRYQTMRLIILPQAAKVIVPPLTNQFLNLTKNSSLATAIAFPDLVSVFAGTVLNQTGHAIEIICMTMGVYLFISLCLSLIMVSYERRTAWK